MDLLFIARKIWRHKFLTLPVILLTLAGAVAVVVVKEPLYEASTSYLLINPPPGPTTEEIARNPELGRIRSDNPYTRFSDQSVVTDVLERAMSTESTRRILMRAGADPRYTVGAAAEFGSYVPIVQITGLGSTPETAIRSAKIVSRATLSELDRMQRQHDVDARYRITTMQVEVPDGAQLKASGQLRMLVGVLGLGTVLLFIVVSVTDAIETLRRERSGERAPAEGPRPTVVHGDRHLTSVGSPPPPAQVAVGQKAAAAGKGRHVASPDQRDEENWFSRR